MGASAAGICCLFQYGNPGAQVVPASSVPKDPYQLNFQLPCGHPGLSRSRPSASMGGQISRRTACRYMEKSGFITCKTPFRVAGKRNPAKVEACSRRSVPPYGKRPLRKMEQSFFGGRIPRSHVRDKDARLFSDGDGANAASFCGSLNSLQYDFRRQRQRGEMRVHDL